jgi:FtsZ-binding cell division protein ZapB
MINDIELAELNERAGQFGIDLIAELALEIIRLKEENEHLHRIIDDMKDLDNESWN